MATHSYFEKIKNKNAVQVKEYISRVIGSFPMWAVG